MNAAAQQKKAELVRCAGEGLAFYDSVLARLTKVIEEFHTDGQHSAAAVRNFLGHLYSAWSENKEENYIVLITRAFDNAAAKPDAKHDPRGEKMQHFREFLFDNLSTSQPHPTPSAQS
jgi:hypothetical protein